MRRLAALVFGLVALAAAGQDRAISFGLRVVPQALVPIGESAGYFGLGGGGGVVLFAHLPVLPALSPSLDLGFSVAPINVGGPVKPTSLGLARMGLGCVFAYPVGARLSLQAEVAGGYYTGFVPGSAAAAAGSFYVRAGTGVGFFLNSRVGLDLDVTYMYHQGLYQGFAIGLGSTVRLSGAGGGAVPSLYVPALLRPSTLPAGGFLRLSNARLQPVFPILFKYYDDHPVGTVVLANTSQRPLTGVEVSLSMEQYVDNPKRSALIERLAPGEVKGVDLYALFNDRVLTITEGTKVAARLTVEYQVDGRPGQDAETVTLELYDRNALRWDDNRKVAAFVTAKDDEVQRFAKNSASLEQQGRRDALSTNLQLAMVMLAALKEHGLTYVVDPKSSYRELSANKAAVDYIQFPRQTLQFKGGDCDDLSVAFCALLEAVGVPTAFITVPGHIFPAFQLDQDAKEASRAFSNPDDLIIAKDTTVWIPVEVTILQEGFLQAWAAGAREWREQIPAGRAGFWRTAEAWETYQPVAFTVGSFQITTPAEAQVRASFEEEMQKLVASEIRERQQTLLAALQLAPDDARSRNELGVLYARYGLEEEARGQFTRIIAQREYAPALLNLGLLLFLHGRVEEATGYFERAVRADSQSAPALLALTRAYHAQENYGMARRYYDQLARVDAGLAERFAYLKLQGAEAGRAADAARLTRLLVWGE